MDAKTAALNARLPPTQNPKFDRVISIWDRTDDGDAYRKAAAEGGFSTEDTERGAIVRYWSPLHSSKEAFIYHEWDLFDENAKLIAHEVDIEDTGAEPD
jgi:hypothetical protein